MKKILFILGFLLAFISVNAQKDHGTAIFHVDTLPGIRLVNDAQADTLMMKFKDDRSGVFELENTGGTTEFKTDVAFDGILTINEIDAQKVESDTVTVINGTDTVTIQGDEVLISNGTRRVILNPERITLDNPEGETFIGLDAGKNALSNTRCTYVGEGAGETSLGGVLNSAFGNAAFQTGGGSATSSRNTSIGALSGGFTNSNDNAYLGYRAGFLYSTSNNGRNTFIGSYSGDQALGEYTTNVGFESGYISRKYCVNLGAYAGRYETRDSIIHITYKTTGTEAGDELFSPFFYNGNNGLMRLNADSVRVSGDIVADGVISGKKYVGQLYIDGDSVFNIGTPDTYFTFNQFQQDISENTTLTDSSITIGAGGDGLYMISSSQSFTFSTNNTVVHFSLFVNDVEKTVLEIEQKVGTGGDVGSSSNQCLINLSESDVVKIKIKASAAGNLTVGHMNLHIAKL